jgi:chromosome segregation ATPase
VEYFVNDKIVCSTFENAMKLQRECKITNIVTYEGTEFKQGMVSGGQHTSNIFNLSLGSSELDRDIKKLSAKIQKLSETMASKKNVLKEAQNSES